jgi:hypothetical protein
MSAPITEAHRRLACEVLMEHSVSGAATKDGVIAAAQLIADSEVTAVQIAMLREYGNLCAINEGLAKECDQLRAEVEHFKFLHQCESDSSVEAFARARRAEAEVERLGRATTKGQVNWMQESERQQARAERAEAELKEWSPLNIWGGTPGFIHAFVKGQQARIHAAQDIEVELAAERARLDWLMAGGVCMMQHSGGFHISRLHTPVSRAAIDAAMKEGAK